MKYTRTLKSCLLALIFLAFISVDAQVSLSIDTPAFPAQVHIGDTFSVNVIISNDSSVPVSCLINFQANINNDTIVTADTNTTSLLSYRTGSVLENIPAHGSIVRALGFNVTNPPFIIGSSGVVIWPIVNGASQQVHIADSVQTNVTVLYPAGIGEIAERNLNVYLNNQQLTILSNGGYLLNSVRLYDVAGNLIYQQPIVTSGVINMSQYPEGIYFAQVTFADNTKAVVKVVNTR